MDHDEKINMYIERLNLDQRSTPLLHDIIESVEVYGRANRIPIIDPAGARVLSYFTRWIGPRTILEIGTAIGYSALLMAAAAPQAQIITLEIDHTRGELAEHHFRQADLSERIQVIYGDAAQTIPHLNQSFDLVFLDAAKGKYEQFFDLVFPLLNNGGLLIVDNVLFRGMVIMDDDLIDRKYRSMVRKLKRFNHMLSTHPRIDTLFLPAGDGLAIGRKLYD